MRTSIRVRLMILMLVPAVALLALAGVQLRSTLRVSSETSTFQQFVDVAEAQYALVHALQVERTRTVEAFFLGAGGGMDMTGGDLADARAATDAALERLQQTVDPSLLAAADPAVEVAYVRALGSAQDLLDQRQAVDEGRILDVQVQGAYQEVITAFLDVDDAIVGAVSHPDISRRLQATSAFARLKATALTRGDTTLLAVAGSTSASSAGREVSALANQQALWVDVVGRLTTPEERAAIESVAAIDPATVVSGVVSGLQAGNLGTVEEIAAENRSTAGQLLSLENQLAVTSQQVADTLRTDTTRDAVIFAAVAAAALLFIVVLVLALNRGVMRPLRRLTAMAGRVAHSLPGTVEAVAAGGEVTDDVLGDTSHAELLRRGDELGDLARALGAATDQATSLALDQARTRLGIAQTISDVARREQSLVERQLALLEVMEDREEDPEQLGQLFKLDHLATRMRRNAENLLLLSAGQLPGSGDSDPQSLVDVIRTAAAETEEYARVDVRVGLPLDIVGYAATPVSHLLAEIIENATAFSPPQTRVTVTAQRVGEGVTVTVGDHGLGMAPADLAEARHRLSGPPLLEAAESRRLGLYVVGLLAQRLGIVVDLQPGEGAGLDVHVWLPDTLFMGGVADGQGPGGLAAALVTPHGGVETVPGPMGALRPAAPVADTPEAGVADAPTMPVAAAPAPSAPDPQPARRVQTTEPDLTPDTLSAMQRLLDATPSAPPPLPDDVAPPVTEHLPHRAPSLPQRQAPPEQEGGLSFARSSNGSTVSLDPDQISRLMSDLAGDLDHAPTGPSTFSAPVESGPTVAPAPVMSELVHTPPTPTGGEISSLPISGGTSSWSTPFPQQRGKKR